MTKITETPQDGGRHGRGLGGSATQGWTPLPALLDDLAGDSFAQFHRRLKEAGHTDIRQEHGCVFRFIHEGGSIRPANTSGMSSCT